MWKGSFEPGWKVKNLRDERFGVIVPDSLGICGKKDVMVEYDRLRGEKATKKNSLRVLSVVKTETDYQACGGCVFFTGMACLRYSRGRMSMMSGANGKRIPDRIYPHCKEAGR